MSSLDSFLKRLRADEAPTIDLEAGGRLRARAKNAPSIDLDDGATRATSMLGAEQRAAIDAVLKGKHVLIHGPGGTGKTYLIEQLRRELRRCGKKVEVTASTGIAAVNVKGRTVHSWSQVLWDKPIAFWPDASPDDFGPSKNSRYNLPDVLIIDEISMLSADFMDKLDKRLRYRYVYVSLLC
ncbi:hypothetical protein AMAG_18314 [Allomyces macrogynus ATCC 38327]|uniref:ATP-dependent DNA helicase n=1 Tax=Allomyces macrogynus (strain ATCC 38327) TaxID=578462 RepID=A0A0L0S8N0_ALLM3|nr:hypothetical protein AMAG_18314 [Allomyces macrogynus ATCC 38327]|eukprot:KNE58832.1 hypothetical protein AMAG_18314 [Allomyces macrogynus ATCC 38327]